MEDLKFIKLVQSHKNLYDKKHPLYEDERAKASSWLAISLSMNKSDDEVIRRWTALRKRFIEYRKKLSYNQSGAARYPVKHWPLYKSLGFLNEHVTMRLRQITPTLTLPDQDLDEASYLDPLNPLDFENIYVDESSLSLETKANSRPFEESLHHTPRPGTPSASETSNSELASVSWPTSPNPPNLQRGSLKRKQNNDPSSTTSPLDTGDRAASNGMYFKRFGNPANQPTNPNDEACMAFGHSVGLQLNLIRSPAARLQVQAQICTLMAEAFREQENLKNE